VIKVASYILENLFTRPAAMNRTTDAAGRQAIDDHPKANAIVRKPSSPAADRALLVALSKKYSRHLATPIPSAELKNRQDGIETRYRGTLTSTKRPLCSAASRFQCQPAEQTLHDYQSMYRTFARRSRSPALKSPSV